MKPEKGGSVNAPPANPLRISSEQEFSDSNDNIPPPQRKNTSESATSLKISSKSHHDERKPSMKEKRSFKVRNPSARNISFNAEDLTSEGKTSNSLPKVSSNFKMPVLASRNSPQRPVMDANRLTAMFGAPPENSRESTVTFFPTERVRDSTAPILDERQDDTDILEYDLSDMPFKRKANNNPLNALGATIGRMRGKKKASNSPNWQGSGASPSNVPSTSSSANASPVMKEMPPIASPSENKEAAISSPVVAAKEEYQEYVADIKRKPKNSNSSRGAFVWIGVLVVLMLAFGVGFVTAWMVKPEEVVEIFVTEPPALD